MLTKPRWILHLEGAPGLFMVGYLLNVKWGAAIDNLVHTVTLPVAVVVAGFVFARPGWTPCALIWLAHIGIDRALGYGLKYPTLFKDTHLQHV